MKTIFALLIASTALATAMPAEAQRYYAREKLHPGSQTVEPTYTYTPKYGAYAACSAGSKQATMTGCTRNDNVSVATSFCSASPAVKTTSCFTCTLTQNMTTSFGAYNSTTVATYDAALALCNTVANENGKGLGACTWNSGTKAWAYGTDANNGPTYPTSGAAYQYAGRCSATQ